MEVKLQVLVMLAMALSLFSAASAEQGLAVYYNPHPEYYPAACAGFNKENSGVMIAGVRDELWDNGRACGRILRVSCTKAANEFPHPCKGGVITVKVVDYCRQPCNGVINLSRDAFETIADLKAGKIWVEYS
ncbi:EG45-like domain containing protein 2 [Rhodamnia argentea]|uniref:EG45-like domain containing protein 2 n=1 Tax=Rhodamnia argentea TaxID=178133 RepID=A0A8B8PLK1_9MYRT|nr:EG45-like domain containing protein 2 [Rhodamnia argentea]